MSIMNGKSSLNFKLPPIFLSCMCLCLNLYRFLFLLFYARHIRSHKSDRTTYIYTDPIRERTSRERERERVKSKGIENQCDDKQAMTSRPLYECDLREWSEESPEAH